MAEKILLLEMVDRSSKGLPLYIIHWRETGDRRQEMKRILEVPYSYMLNLHLAYDGPFQLWQMTGQHFQAASLVTTNQGSKALRQPFHSTSRRKTGSKSALL